MKIQSLNVNKFNSKIFLRHGLGKSILGFLFVIVWANAGVEAQVPPLPIISSGLNTQVSAPVNLPSGAVQHNITGGTRPGGGGNLFHSFGEFGVPTNNIANFLNDAALPTSNILSRVTGGNPSNILGTIQTEGFGNANLFLMNPAGIVFGPNASLHVSGSTHFTTADYLKLADGVQFTALPSAQDAVLSMAPVAAFGFLESTSAPITVNGSTSGEGLSLVGGDISIGSILNAPGGKIGIVSVASPGEVLADTFDSAPNINGQSFTTMGNIALSEGALLDVSGDAAGTVIIRGGELMMANARISADTGDGDGASTAIDIDVIGDISIYTVDGPALTARASGIGNAGEVKLSSGGAIDISGTGIFEFQFPYIDTHTSGPGDGGNVTITSKGDLTVTGDPFVFTWFIESGTDGFDVGKGGDISISVENFLADTTFFSTGNFFSSFNFGEGAGTAGDVSISADEKIDLTFSEINTDSFDFFFETGGNAGSVTLAAPEVIFDKSAISTAGWDQGGNVTINSDTVGLSESTIVTTTRTEHGGAVTISGRVLELVGSNIVSTTNENADAGDITLTATERLTLLNLGGSNDVPSGILSNSFATDGNGILGTPGDILIDTPILEMSGGSRINTTSGSSGNGGNVLLNTQKISMSGQTSGLDPEDLFNFGEFQPTGVFTRSIGGSCLGPCGDAGNVTISTDSIVLNAGAQINSGTTTDGRGGEIVVHATTNIFITGTLEDGTPGGVLSLTTGTGPGSGDGGAIALTSGESFTLSDRATISASSDGPGNAGNIQLTATDTILLDGATVTTEAAQASGGNIKLTAQDLIRLNDSTISSSVQGDATTAGGNINIDPDFIILQNSKILAKAVQGQGGNISLIANNAVLVDPLSVLDASSALGVSGSVDIQAPIQNLSGTLAPLPEETVPVTALYGARCAAGSGGHFSTFVDSKAGSLSPTPGAFLASPLLNLSASAHGVADRSASQQGSVILTASIAPLVLGHAGEPTTACP